VIRVDNLVVYPVKSCGGCAVDRARVTATGFEWDRSWMAVGADGRFLSQRETPRLALVRPRLSAGSLVLTAPRLPEIELPLVREPAPAVRVIVWRDQCDALDEGLAAAEWLSTHLGQAARLVRLAGDDARPLGTSAAQPGDRLSFADAYPFLLLSAGSLAELNRRLHLPVPMSRFRPNIVVGGCPPHAEDGWRALRIGGVDFRVAKPCSRCVVTTTDQETAERGPEPLRTLAAYRLRGGEVLFGQNLIHGGRGSIAAGDPVVVLAAHQELTWS
jgi:hypothetical protein